MHPFSDRGRFATTDATSPFVIQDDYFDSKRFEGTEARDGLRMHFAGWSRPLEAYVAALEDARFAITSLREPVPQVGPQFLISLAEGAALGFEIAGWELVTVVGLPPLDAVRV